VNEESPLAERHMGFFVMNSTNDELVKSHIPYVVHASTKPVLNEPFVPSTGSLRARLRPGRAHAPEEGPTGPEAGRTVVSECPERSRRKRSCFGELSRTEYH